MVEILGYNSVVVGNETIYEPIYAEPIITIGYGEDQIVMSLAEYEEQHRIALEAAEAERLAQENFIPS